MNRPEHPTLTDADWCEAVSLCLLVRDARLSGADIHQVAVDLAAKPASRALEPQAAADLALHDGIEALAIDGDARVEPLQDATGR